ncbi:Fam107b [Columba livia]|nr:Fam107b [Columba livia]
MQFLFTGLVISAKDLLQLFPCSTDTVNKDTEPKDPYPIPRKIMAEPDYIDDDNPELIRPQKLINPVKSSRNHQDLHRELLMNQKRNEILGGFSPAEKLLELEQQKIQEEQENAPEFVKVKGNLRRTVQDATEAPDS